MASEPSFGEAILLILGAGAFVMWVVSDVLEEQMLGRTRRERQAAVKQRAKAERRRESVALCNVRDACRTTLPTARVHRRS